MEPPPNMINIFRQFWHACPSFFLFLLVVTDLVGLFHVRVVKDPEDVLAGPVDASPEKEVGEAEAKVLRVQLVIPALELKLKGINVFFYLNISKYNNLFLK